MPMLSVIVITKNEERRIRRCLESVRWADEIVVVDSGSTDETLKICREFTDRILVRSFDTFSSQKNAALDRATGDWVLSLDADEVVSPSLTDELCAMLGRDGDGCNAFVLRRENYFCGRPIRYVWGRDALVRVVRRGCGRFRGEVHEKLGVSGRIGELTQALLHYNSENLHEYVAKNNLYTSLEAQLRYHRGEQSHSVRLFLSPLRVFLFRYIRLQGFRDGKTGFILCVLLAFFTFLVHLKLLEFARSETNQCSSAPLSSSKVEGVRGENPDWR